MSFELTDFQLLTPGLYSADEIKIRINFRVQATGFWRFTGWQVIIWGFLNGQTMHHTYTTLGDRGGQDNVELVFTGKMPVSKHLTGKLEFRGRYLVGDVRIQEFAEKSIVIPNLDDAAPDPPDIPEPPVVCTEGQTKCEGYHLMECVNNKWVTKQYWAVECGWTPTPPPEPPEPPPPEPPPPEPPPDDPWTPPDIPGWFERNKHIIIPVAITVIVIALIVILAKTRPAVRSPVKGWRSPVYRRK